MGHDETKQVSRVRMHVLAMDASVNTSDIRIYMYIPTSKSEYTLREHTVSRGYEMTLILIIFWHIRQIRFNAVLNVAMQTFIGNIFFHWI